MKHFFTLRNFLRTLAYGYVVGVLVVIVTSLGERVNVGRMAVYIIVIGLCINSMIWLFELLFRRTMERLSFNRQLPMHVVLTTFGGVTGYVIGRVLASLLVNGTLPPTAVFAQPLLITVGVSLFVGATMWSYFQIEERLREKVREQELAQQELTLARAIQERLLPPPELSADGYRVTARNLPAQFVAGDFYDLITRADGTVVAVVADVAGKGVAASLIMASVKSVLPMIAAVESVESTMRRLNEKLARELSRREFVALTCAAYDPVTRRVVIANAGLPDPYLIRDGIASPLVVDGPRFPLGIRAEITYQSLTIDLQSGDRLLLLTDGLPEAPIAGNDLLGYERFSAIAATSHATLEALFAAVEKESPGPRNDDWTAVMIEVA